MMWKIFMIKMIDGNNAEEYEWFYYGTLKEAFNETLLDAGGQDGIVELSIMCYE